MIITDWVRAGAAQEDLAMTDRDGSAYLVPNLGVKEDSPYSSNHLRTLKKELAEVAGVEFRPKDFRSTFASLTLKKDLALLVDISRQLGHGSHGHHAALLCEHRGERRGRSALQGMDRRGQASIRNIENCKKCFD